MLRYNENGSEIYLFSFFMKTMYKKNTFETCKTGYVTFI